MNEAIRNDFDGDPGSLFEHGLISEDEAILLSTTNVPNPEREALSARLDREMTEYLRKEHAEERLIRVTPPTQEAIENARKLGFLNQQYLSKG